VTEAVQDRASPPRGELAAQRRRSAPIPWGGAAVVILASIFAVFLALPIVTLIARSILSGSLAAIAGSSALIAALGLSLATTAVSLALTVVFGLPLAFVLARRSFRGKWLVEAIVDLPIVLPPAVAGLALLLVFGRRGLLGGSMQAAGIDIAFTVVAVVLAQTFVSAPFFIRSARAGIAGVDRDLEDAARVDGATEGRVFRDVTVPLSGGVLAGGLVMSWARALGEFGATIMFAGSVEGRTQTLPLVVYAEFQGGDVDAAIAGAVILVLAALGVLVAVRVFHWGRAFEARSVT
jgi:molybdate transport system permease protein